MSEDDERGEAANDHENPTEEILTEEPVKPPVRDRRRKKVEPTAPSDVAAGTGDVAVGTGDGAAVEAKEPKGGEPEMKEPLIGALPKKKSLFGKLYSPLRRRTTRKPPKKVPDVADDQSEEGVVWQCAVPGEMAQYDSKKPEERGIRGWAIIFYYSDFTNGLPPREGVEHDLVNLRRVFKERGFLVKEYPVAHAQDLERHDSLVICFLSHGLESRLYATDADFDESELWREFCGDRCPALNGKPKLFFIQACRGHRLDHGVMGKMSSVMHSLADSLDSSGHHGRRVGEHHLPTHADILVAHSTFEGHVSWNNAQLGSYFVYTLCKVMEQHSANLDILKVLTMVAGIIARDFKSTHNQPERHAKKQMPTIRSTLTKDLYLLPLKPSTSKP
ncbi:unnamed protein product [Darwinula stevensoni]|uniref:Caspase n=1 Tax=Darwinula stevensoni TaxID=69355 RepID=A0A7R8X489_9CRUS|nr:unnamed protein product [Darwinula stevensoni]CAG0878829.1 unnamed protein product [Darwinula stevensoni]